MLPFIVVILIVGALLSCIFGKGIGQLFVLGTGTLVLLGIGILLLLLSPLIYGYFTAPSHVGTVDMQTYHNNYNTAAPAPSPYNTAGTSYGTAGASSGNSGTAYASPVAATPKIGIVDGGFPRPEDLASFALTGAGDLILAVAAGSPAEAKGLRAGDILISAATDGFSEHKLLSPQYALDSFERDHPASSLTQPIALYVYRPSDRSAFYVHVMPQ